jgi:hypothetical protein
MNLVRPRITFTSLVLFKSNVLGALTADLAFLDAACVKGLFGDTFDQLNLIAIAYLISINLLGP